MSTQVYQLGGYGSVGIPNAPIQSPRDPISGTDILSPNGNPYQLGQFWRNFLTGTVFEFLGGGVWAEVSQGTGGPITTLTGNTGGAISPLAGNIDILGAGTVTVTGTPNTLTVTTMAGGFPITPFVVGPVGQAGYQTIQSAITAAVAAGGGSVYVQPGTYTENLTLANGINVIGTIDGNTTITGVHVPPATGSFYFQNVTLTSATHIFSSAVAGSAALTVEQCIINVTNGYLFNLLNWTGTLASFNCGSIGTNDGFINNTGGSNVICNSSDLGNGTANPFIISGNVNFRDIEIRPAGTFQGAAKEIDISASIFLGTVTTAGSVTTFMGTSIIQPAGATAAITHGSSNPFFLDESAINSSNATVIGGAGAGALRLGNVTFDDSSGIASTLTVVYNRVIGRISPYVVGASGSYLTIQAAITAAAAAGGGTVYVQPGTYTENLTLSDGINVVGSIDGNTIITGVHIPPASGSFYFQNLTLTSLTHIFSSAVAGTAAITVELCVINATNGYLFNLLNWTGPLLVFDSGSVGTNDGFVNNTGGASIDCNSSDLGNGSVNACVISGPVNFRDVELRPPVTFQGSSEIDVSACIFLGTVTTAGSVTTFLATSVFQPNGATSAISHGSTGIMRLGQSIINSSNANSIDGAGTGVLHIEDVAFEDNTVIAGTLTLGTTSVLKATNIQSLTTVTAATGFTATTGDITATTGDLVTLGVGSGVAFDVSTASGATPQIVNARVGSATFTGISIAAAADLTLVITNSAIAGASTRVMLSMIGATTGSATSIKSVTPSAGSLSIVVTNGTGATTTTADITFDFIVLN